MSDDSEKVDEILEELDLEGSSTDDNISGPSQETETRSKSRGRLEKLRDAGALTEEEYDILKNHGNDSAEPTTNSPDFGQPVVTSEGSDMDFSIVGVFEDIDSSPLTIPKTAKVANLGDDQVSSLLRGGSSRTLICWHIYNHSDTNIEFDHDNIEHIGQDKFSYEDYDSEIGSHNLKSGWNCDNSINISAGSRIKYVSSIEIPAKLSEVELAGYWSDVHNIEITEEMKFPKSELPANVDL